ncbi:MAG TPA: alkaline phosphatase family protein [Thermoanaerobaculia bacterium]|nr:alkaline phosphatase family protein [Thermoanaerobaculia bacterium]
MPSLNEKIKHVVVLMLENRSFDHMLAGVKFATPVKQATISDFNLDASKKKVPVSFNATPGIDVGPDHGHLGVMVQLTGRDPDNAKPPRYNRPYKTDNSGFIQNFESVSSKHDPPHPQFGVNIMKCHPETDVPVLATLAKEFAVCDQWFCSVPGQTWPNRNFAHSGTSDGETNIRKRTFTNPTLFERLDQAKKRWRVYHDGIAQVWVYPRLWDDKVFRGRFHDISRLAGDVASGNMPEYTFIEPRHFGKSANSQHPENPNNAESFHGGEALIKFVYDTLRSNPKVWNQTLLVITYDEHGGFYDHVSPPENVVRPDKKVSSEGFQFDMLGVRVPAVLVSPWIERGTVDSTVYDHCSIGRSVRELFGVPTPLSAREAVAKTFWRNVTRAKVRGPKEVPEVEVAPTGLESLESVMPVDEEKALTDNEENYAWLAFHMARALEEQRRTGAPKANTTIFWESTDGRLVTKRAEPALESIAPASPTPAIVIDNPDKLSAFGQHVSDLMHETAEEEPPITKPVVRRRARR